MKKKLLTKKMRKFVLYRIVFGMNDVTLIMMLIISETKVSILNTMKFSSLISVVY